MNPRMWQRMPTSNGPHWFCQRLEDRDLAKCYRVYRVEEGSRLPYYECPDMGWRVPITESMGWWLLIVDERKTAPVKEYT